MIKIEITDAQELPPRVLRATAEYLLALAGAPSKATVQDALKLEAGHTVVSTPTGPVMVKSNIAAVEDINGLAGEDIIEQQIMPETAAYNPFAQTSQAPATNGPELDVRGFPWNERIHSRGMSKNDNGSWKYRRQISPKLIKEVEDKYMGIVPIAAPPPPPPPVPVVAEPVAPVITFQSIMEKITGGLTVKKITHDWVHTLLKSKGITSPTLLAMRPDAFQSIDEAIDEALR